MFFVYKYNLGFGAHHRAPEGRHAAAYSSGGAAVVAAIGLFGAGRLGSELLRAARRGDVARAVDGALVVGGQLVAPDYEIDLFVAEKRRGHAVAYSVDVYDFAAFGERVGRRYVEVRRHGFFADLRALLLPVPDHRVVLFEQLVEPELLRRRAAAYADGRAVDFAVEVGRGLRAGREDLHRISSLLQRLFNL